MHVIAIAPGILIEEYTLEERFVRSAGPGGQNVNKVATAVELRFDLNIADTLSYEHRLRISRLAGRRVSRDGIVVIHANRFRSQDRNRADAMTRLTELIVEAAAVPKVRRPTRLPASSKRKRLGEKKAVAERKAGRRALPIED